LIAVVAFCALIIGAPLVLSARYYDFTVAPREAVLQIGTAAIMIIWLVGLIAKGGRVLFPAGFNYVLVLVLFSGVTLLWAVNPWEGFPRWLHWAVAVAALVIVGNLQSKGAVLGTIFASGVLVALIGLLQYYVGLDWFLQIPGVEPASTFGNKGFAGHYVAFTIPVGLYFVRWGQWRVAALMIGGYVVAGRYLLLADVNAAYLGLGGAAIWLLIYRRRWAAVALVLGAGVVFYWFHPPNELPARLELWRNGARMAIDHPEGVGLKNYKIIYPAYHKDLIIQTGMHTQVEYAHNDFIQFWAEAGFTGVALLIMAIIGVRRAIWRKNPMSPYAVASLVCMAVIAGLSFPMNFPMSPFIGASLVGVAGS